MTAPLIKVSGLTIGYGEAPPLLKDINFEIQPGDVFAILGGSGCGKSTLMRCLTGLNQSYTGQIERFGVVNPGLRVGRPDFGVMFQGGALLGSMTVGENVGLALEQWTDLPHEAIAAVVLAKLRLVGLQGTEDKLPAEISGGMRKRAAIARALALEPTLVFLDEPSAGLDPVTAAELDELILSLNRSLNLTVVVVTHELPSVFKIANRCILLDRDSKSLIAEGEPNQLRDTTTDARVRGFFNRLPKEH
jgi:phospholipid/cholesterol/gamma-HCH transport system ATP-binding protein